jgi:tetratricopeptide (TPR) repeat protein
MLVAGLGVSIALFFRAKAAGEEQARLHRIAQEARLTEIGLREAAEFREQVAKAAVQLGRGNTEEADRLLAGVPLEHSPVSLEAADCYHRIALWHVSAGRWTMAAERFSSAVHALANVDDSDSDSISRNLLPASTALCYAGDLAGYERFRGFALRRFAGTSHPLVAEQVVKSTLLRPIGAAKLRELDELALVVERALEDPGSVVAKDEYLAAWCYLALGLKCYRQDEFVLASRWLNLCLASSQVNAPRMASARSLLAMIEQRSGRPENARAFWELARAPVQEVMTKPLQQGGTPQGFWFDWINAKLFLTEAEGLIGGGESAGIEAAEKK